MDQRIRITGLTDLDRVTLEDEFSDSGMAQAVSFEESGKAAGGVGVLEPLSATLVVTAMGLTVLAIWICAKRKKDTKIELESSGTKVTITTNESSECKANVLAQLAKLFPKVLTSSTS